MGKDDHREAKYDVNSKIMLTAIISLSVVVLLVTILHIYVRCLLRRRQRDHRQTGIFQLGFIVNPTLTESGSNHGGLPRSVISSIPVFAFTNDDQMNGSLECSVCLSMLENGEMARTLPNCKHTFHAECIDKWFASNSTCPICRTGAEPRPEAAEPAAGGGAPPSAPPLEEISSITDGGVQIQSSAAKLVGSSNSSRLSSFRRILSRERSSQRVRSFGEEDGLPEPDLERQ